MSLISVTRLCKEFRVSKHHRGAWGGGVADRSDRRATYRFARGSISASELIQRLSAQCRILDLSVQEPQIEDTVRKIYEQGLLREV